MAEWQAQAEREGDVGGYVRRLIVADMRHGGKYRELTELEKAQAAARALKAEREAERQARREASRWRVGAGRLDAQSGMAETRIKRSSKKGCKWKQGMDDADH